MYRSSVLYCIFLLTLILAAAFLCEGIKIEFSQLTTSPKSSDKKQTFESIKGLPESSVILSTTTTSLSVSEWMEFQSQKTTFTTTITTPSNIKTIATTPATEKSTTSKDLNNTSYNLKTVHLNMQYCFCDLQLLLCDINCCCDPDCGQDVLKVFTCSVDDHELQRQNRYLEDFKSARRKVPTCEKADGWLCVFRTNIKKIKDEEKWKHFNYEKAQFYTWSDLYLPVECEDCKNREFYKYNDPVQLINTETNAITTFELPISYHSPYCNRQASVQHLKPFKKYCLMADAEQLTDIQDNLINMKETYKMAHQPNMDANELESLGPNIKVMLCNITEQQCSVNQVDVYLDNMLLTKVYIKILHNYTHINGCLMELWFRERVIEEKEEEMWLLWQLEFFNKTFDNIFTKNPTENYGRDISGPLGYMLNKPVIMSKYVQMNQNSPLTATNQSLDYFLSHTNATHTLKIFSKKHGNCHQSSSLSHTINYGINEYQSCKFQFSNDSFIALDDIDNINFTSICVKLQHDINYQLFGDEIDLKNIKNYFISKLGRPQDNMHQWIPLITENVNGDAAVGHFNKHLNTFTCYNILLSLKYEFHVATKQMEGATSYPQHTLERAVLIMGERHNLEFSLDELLKIPLHITARFYNLNAITATLSRAPYLLMTSYFIKVLAVYTIYVNNYRFT